MSKFYERFGGKPIFLAVIHVTETEQALRNARIAETNGADGIFLISHHKIRAHALIEIYLKVRTVHPTYWIGLNYLDLSTAEAFRIHPRSADGLWADNSGIYPEQADPTLDARIYAQMQKTSGFEGLYFGSVAFKYQQRVTDPAGAARVATAYMDVVTTSGEGTGTPPRVEKIRNMREAIEDHPLGIASGITPENVSAYVPFANCFLVATGIGESFTELDPSRVRQLADKLAQ